MRVLSEGPVALRPEETDASFAKLLKLQLVARSRRQGRVLYYAREPRSSWLALAAKIVWDKVSTPVPVQELPAVDDPESENLRLLCFEIAEAAAQVYRTQTGLIVGDERTLETAEELSQIVCDAVTQARSGERIVAVHRSPFLIPTHSFWPALTGAMDRGTTYHRVTDLDEIVTHGLTIAARDIDVRGIDTRVIERAVVVHRFYLVGSRFLIVINSPEAADRGVRLRGVGSLVGEQHVIRRYAEHHADYAARAILGKEVIARLRKDADLLVAKARADLRPIEVAWLQDLVEYGRFSVFSKNEFAAAERTAAEQRLLRQGFVRCDAYDALVPNYRVSEDSLRGA